MGLDFAFSGNATPVVSIAIELQVSCFAIPFTGSLLKVWFKTNCILIRPATKSTRIKINRKFLLIGGMAEILNVNRKTRNP
jgi:hypothetical protein